MHSGEKSNKCSQCNYASSWAGNLKMYLKTHSGGKSNRCNKCDLVSNPTRWSLLLHLGFSIQATEKYSTVLQYIKCSRCDCSHACSLRKHLKTHTGEKTNKCNQCDYASSCGDVLRIHLKKKTPWNQVNQVPTVWLCIPSGRRFKETHKITQWK